MKLRTEMERQVRLLLEFAQQALDNNQNVQAWEHLKAAQTLMIALEERYAVTGTTPVQDAGALSYDNS